MKVSDILTQFGDLMQGINHGGWSYSWKFAYFIRDALSYICGEKPKYGLRDYLDDEGFSFWNNIQEGFSNICWANVDRGPFGFRPSEEYAYLPCCDDFLAELAYKLYGNSDNSSKEKIIKEIKSLGFLSEKESLDVDNQFMDNKIIKTILTTYSDFFQFAGKKEDNFMALISLFLDTVWLNDMETGVGEWKLLKVESPALNEWLSFLYSDAVSDQDRLSSMQILSTLIDTPITLENDNNEMFIYSHESASPYFDKPYEGIECTHFSLVVMQNAFGNYNFGYEECYFWFGLVNPHFLSAMYNVRDFLEEMDEKYHYLSSNSHQTAAGGEKKESYHQINGSEAKGEHNG